MKLKQPPGLWCLFIVEMWERFSYYGMRAILVLYLVAEYGAEITNPGRGWTDADASHLYGYYTGLVYLTPILGGLIADRLIGTHRSMVAGSLLIALGHVTLAISGIGDLAENHAGMSVFICGLALIIFGTGHFKPCVSVMVGQLYEEHDPRRDGGFTIFYMGINVGAFFAPVVCGFLGERIGWHYGFGAAAVGMILGLSTYLMVRPMYLQGIGDPPEGRRNTMPLFILGSIGLSILVGLLYLIGAFAAFGAALDGLTEFIPAWILTFGGIVLILALAGWFISIQGPGEKGPVFTVLCFIIFNAVFWLAFEQAGSSLTLFADRDTDRVIFGWEMPASWFQTINPFLIVALAPLYSILWGWLAKRRQNPTQSLKIAYGLLLLGAGYIFMVAGGVRADAAKVGIFWLTAAYFLHTTGELCLSPTGLSFVTKASPVKWISFIMGLWFLSSVVANFGGGLVAGTVTLIEAGQVEVACGDGGTITVTDRVGGEKQRLAVLAPDAAAEQTVRGLGILHPDGVRADSFDGDLIARAGYRPPAATLGDVIELINGAEGNDGKIVASIADDGMALQLTDHTGGAGTLTVAPADRSHTAENLGLDEPAVDAVLAGRDLFQDRNVRAIRRGVKLAELNGSRGVAISDDRPELLITMRDGSVIEVNLGRVTRGVRPQPAATTLAAVVDRIMDVADNGDLRATLTAEGRLVLTDKSRGDGKLTVENAPGSTAATDLGIARTAEGKGKQLDGDPLLDGIDLSRLRPDTKLSWLHEGEGVGADHDAVDFRITARDGTVIAVNIGCVNGISDDTPLSELNGGAGVAIDGDEETADIAFIGRDGEEYEVNLSGVTTFGQLAERISNQTGKIDPFWNSWGVRFAGKGDFFFLFVFSAFVAAVVVLILTPLFKRLLHGIE